MEEVEEEEALMRLLRWGNRKPNDNTTLQRLLLM